MGMAVTMSMAVTRMGSRGSRGRVFHGACQEECREEPRHLTVNTASGLHQVLESETIPGSLLFQSELFGDEPVM